jgi:opacity protein-like surface antigen
MTEMTIQAYRTKSTRVREAMYTLALLLGCVLLFSPKTALAQSDSDSELNDIYLRSHQVGGRIGGWANQGDLPPADIDLSNGTFATTDITDGSFYLEGYFAYRMAPWLAAEFSLGLASRGDITVLYQDGGTSYGTLNVYPILVKAKVYPFSSLGVKFHPYLLAGGGVYYGKHSIQIVGSYDALLHANFGEDSETTLGYVLGGGIDWPLASVVALDLNAQYMPIDFGNPLIAVKDYSSLTITVGVKYLFVSKKEDKR